MERLLKERGSFLTVVQLRERSLSGEAYRQPALGSTPRDTEQLLHGDEGVPLGLELINDVQSRLHAGRIKSRGGG